MHVLSPFERKLVQIHLFKISARMGFFFHRRLKSNRTEVFVNQSFFSSFWTNSLQCRTTSTRTLAVWKFRRIYFLQNAYPLGKPEDEITAPKPRASSGSSSKQKATLSKTSATSKHCAQSDRQHDAVMEGIKQLQDQQLASPSSLGTAVHSIVSTVKEFMQFFARAGS